MSVECSRYLVSHEIALGEYEELSETLPQLRGNEVMTLNSPEKRHLSIIDNQYLAALFTKLKGTKSGQFFPIICDQHTIVFNKKPLSFRVHWI